MARRRSLRTGSDSITATTAQRTLTYGEHRHQRADLLLPSGPGPHPVAFVLHGGFWRGRYRRTLMAPMCADLAEHGWAAVNVEYRRLGRVRGGGGGVPTTLEDVAAALDALAGVDAPLDLERVVAIGHSAGGQLALWAGAERPQARVRLAGTVSQAGVCDLERGAQLGLGGGVVQRFCGGMPDAVPDRYAQSSPIRRLPLGIPTLLVHGERDDVVPAELSERYAEAARAGGDPVELVLRPQDGHFEHIDPQSAAWADVRSWLGRFAT